MNKREVFEIWAPADAVWSNWVKPVLFTQIETLVADIEPLPQSESFGFESNLAVVVDLPGAACVAVGLALARVGYRPVPLFNACPAPAFADAAVNVRPILRALLAATPTLRDLSLPADAPPAFLLDARRRFNEVELRPGVFDNRSVSLPTDFPSANRLIESGIRRVSLMLPHDRGVQSDLAHTLHRWQEAGLPIHRYGHTEPLKIHRPSGFRTRLDNLMAAWGLRRNPLGGFGGTLPMPSSG